MLLKNTLKKNALMCVLFFMLCFQGQALPYFRMTDNCLKAQKAIYELKIELAKKILAAEKQQTPDNIAIIWLQEYTLFIPLFISENESDYEKALPVWKSYISTVEKKSFNDPWYRFILSDMLMHRAAVKIKMDALFSAGSDIKSANHFLKDNQKLFPGFLPDNKNLGLIKILCSSVPKNYAWIGSWMGFEGNLKEGFAIMETYLNTPLEGEHECIKTETAFIYAMLQHLYLKKTDVAWTTIDKYTKNYQTNLLQNYMRATIAGYAGKNDMSIAILSEKPHSAELVPFYYMDYMLGVAKLKRLDKDADTHLKIFTVKFKGRNYIKSAYRYLAWHCIANGDMTTASTYYSLCIRQGKNAQEEDKQAEKEALDPFRWTAPFIRSRLLFDGRYFDESLKILNSIEENTLQEIKFKLELNYRKARIYQETGVYATAIIQFDKTIKLGQKQSYYYAAYSALQMGEIYEQLNNKAMAKYYFEKAKDDFPDNQEYRNSIDQKAKSGLKRLGY